MDVNCQVIIGANVSGTHTKGLVVPRNNLALLDKGKVHCLYRVLNP
jgi:hypothetical protein